MPALYADDSKHIILLVKETANKMEYVQHAGKNVSLLVMEKDKFLRTFSAVTSKHTAQTIAQKYLDLAKTGVIITPAARHALQATLNPNSQEATMAVPTTLPKGNSKDKKSAPKTTKLSELPTEGKDLSEAAPEKPKRVAKPKAETVEKPKRERKPKAEAAPWSESDLVADATAEAERIVSEAKAKLAAAEEKHAAKQEQTAAKAAAKKIIEAAKKEAAKIKKQIAKLGGRRSAKAEDDGEEKPKRVSKPRAAKAAAEEDGDDISKMKIVQVNEPRVKEGSAAGARALAVYKSKSVKSALQYEGVTVGLINKMVENGFIELA